MFALCVQRKENLMSNKFNVGDKVALYTNDFSNSIKITEVIKVTPTGRIRLACCPETQFDRYGNKIGGNYWHRSYIEPLTDELREEITKSNTIEKAIYLCHAVKKDSLSYETARELIALLERKEA